MLSKASRVAVCSILVGCFCSAKADQVIIGASQDAALPAGIGTDGGGCGTPYDWSITNQGSGPHLMFNPCEGTSSYGLIQFDLSAIPTGATITNATLTLYHEFNSQIASVDLHANTSAWSESTVTYNTKPTFEAVPVSTAILGTQGQFVTWDVDAVVQAWFDATINNFGLTLIKQPDVAPWPYLASKEHSTLAFRPALTVDFQASAVPEPQSYAVMLALGLVAIGYLRRRSS